ncbi:hypothetical protein [Aeromicrobium sp.]|uniref:hypothetical protein n=1 Tax=Aeromicrobium sp. TaxID=1871063 RepID=UPI0030BDCD89
MTDAASPSSEPASPPGPTTGPAPRNKRRLLIVLGVIALVVVALVVGLFVYASSAAGAKASDYDEDYAIWKSKEKPVLLAATARLPKGTYPRKDTTSPRGIATQEGGCDAVAASRVDVASSADRLPTVGDNGLMASISSDYSDAGRPGRPSGQGRAGLRQGRCEGAGAARARLSFQPRRQQGISQARQGV